MKSRILITHKNTLGEGGWRGCVSSSPRILYGEAEVISVNSLSNTLSLISLRLLEVSQPGIRLISVALAMVIVHQLSQGIIKSTVFDP
jgi:hypothetical protein